MSRFTHDELLLAEGALHSARCKVEKVLQSLHRKASPQLGLIRRTEHQLACLQCMYALIEQALGFPGDPPHAAELATTGQYIEKTLLQLHNLRPKIKEGSAQHSLILRRIAAFEIAHTLLEEKKNSLCPR